MKNLKYTIEYLIYLLIFLLPWQTRWIYKPAEINGGYYEYGTLSLYGTEILLGLIVLLTIIFVYTKISLKNNNFSGKRLLLALLVVMVAILSILLAQNQELAINKISQFALGGALIAVFLVIKPRLLNIAYVFVASTVVQSILAIQQFVTQQVGANKWLGMASQKPEILGTPIIESNGERILRSFGSLPHPNILGGMLIIGLLFIIYIYSKEKNLLAKYLLVIGFMLNSIALFFCFSRSAMLALLMSLAFFYFLVIKMKFERLKSVGNKFLLIFLMVFMIFSAFNFDLTQTRITGFARLEQKSTEERLSGYNDALQIFKNNWLAGVGPGNYTESLKSLTPDQPSWYYQPTHNSIILLTVEFGIGGGLLFCLSIYWLIKNTFFDKKKKINEENLIFVISWFGLLVISLFDHYLYSFWVGNLLFFSSCAIVLQTLLTKNN